MKVKEKAPAQLSALQHYLQHLQTAVQRRKGRRRVRDGGFGTCIAQKGGVRVERKACNQLPSAVQQLIASAHIQVSSRPTRGRCCAHLHSPNPTLHSPDCRERLLPPPTPTSPSIVPELPLSPARSQLPIPLFPPLSSRPNVNSLPMCATIEQCRCRQNEARRAARQQGVCAVAEGGAITGKWGKLMVGHACEGACLWGGHRNNRRETGIAG